MREIRVRGHAVGRVYSLNHADGTHLQRWTVNTDPQIMDDLAPRVEFGVVRVHASKCGGALL